jgi:hypothetical protein
MSEYYYKYFTETEVVHFTPSLEYDYLKVPVYYYTVDADECGTAFLSTEDGQDYVLGNGTAVVRSDFKYNETKYSHVTDKAAAKFKEIYETVEGEYSTLIEMFNFELVVYDETEFFRDAGDPLFDYPYSNQKNNLNYYAPQLGVEVLNSDVIYMKRSIVCLEEFFMDQMNLAG